MITEGEAAILLETTQRAFRNQSQPKQRSTLIVYFGNLTPTLFQIDKSVLKKWGAGENCTGCRLLKDCGANFTATLPEDFEECHFLFNLPSWSDQAIGGVLLALSLLTLCGSLVALSKILKSMLSGW